MQATSTTPTIQNRVSSASRMRPAPASRARERVVPGDRGYFPSVGAACAAMGTVFALATIPFNAAKEGALKTSSLGMAVLFALAPLLAGVANLRNLLRAENIIGLAPIYWILLDLIQGAYPLTGVDPGHVRQGFMCVGVFTTMYWVGTMGSPFKLPDALIRLAKSSPPQNSLFMIAVTCFVLGVTAYLIPAGFDIPLVIASLYKPWGASPWARGDLGGWRSFGDHLAYFGYLLPTLSVMIARRKGWYSVPAVITLLMTVGYMVFVAQSGGRRILGVCVGAALCYWLLDQRKIKVYQIALFAVAIAATLWVMQVMLATRTVGFSQLDQTAALVNASMKGDVKSSYSTLRVDDNFYRICQLTMVLPKPHEFVGFKYIFYVIIRPIPRVFWPGKPVDPGFALHHLVGDGASLSTTVVGELYMSYGFFAVALGGFLYGRGTRSASPVFYAPLGSWAPLFYGFVTMIFFLGYRSLLEVILSSYALISWVLATSLVQRMRS